MPKKKPEQKPRQSLREEDLLSSTSENLEDDLTALLKGISKQKDLLTQDSRISPKQSRKRFKLIHQVSSNIGELEWKTRIIAIAQAQKTGKRGSSSVDELAKKFNISRGQAFKDAKIHNTFFSKGQKWKLTDKTFFQVALEAEDPEEALKYAEKMFFSPNKLTVGDFRRYVRSKRSENTNEAIKKIDFLILPNYRNSAYIDFIKSLPCCISGTPAPSEPYYIEGQGRRYKSSDYLAIPLSLSIYQDIIKLKGGYQALVDKYNVNPFRIALRIMMEYTEELARLRKSDIT